MDKTLLVLNIGSSSIKYAVFGVEQLDVLKQGKIDCPPTDSERILHDLLKQIPQPDIVVHRIVHGGENYSKPVLLNETILKDLERLSAFAPLHQPHNINGVHVIRKLLPHIPQYACFDTAFHAGHDDLHSVLPIPKELRDNAIKRYGFHGLSYDWIARQLKSSRAVVAHLGSGASLCAIRDGKSIDTTMGLTALDGLPMATRTGAIDAGFILYLSRELKYSHDQIEHLLYSESGLKGLSGISGDVRTLQQSADPQAKFAIEFFAFKTAQYIAMMSVSLGGMDSLVFTGGIGENSEIVRHLILGHLRFMPSFDVQIIPTNEEKMMAIQIKEELGHA